MKTLKKLLHSKWTSLKNIDGSKHFEVINIFKKNNTIELYAICNKSVRIIINLNDLKKTTLWVPGWKNL